MRSVMAVLVCVVAGVACSSESTGGGTTSGGGGGGSSSGGGSASSGAQSGTASSAAPSSSGWNFSGFPVCNDSTASSAGATTSSSYTMPIWDCLGEVCWGPPEETIIALRVRAIDYIASSAVADVTIKACRETDLTCATPLTTGMTDSLGYVDLMLPLTDGRAFIGYFELTKDDRVPTIVHFYRPPYRSGNNWVVGVFNPAQLELVSGIAGADEIKPSRGHLGALVEDCVGQNVEGVQFDVDSADGATTSAYLENNIPNASATETDETGAVGFFNLPPGWTYVTARRVQPPARVGRVPALIREGWVTTLVVPPTP